MSAVASVTPHLAPPAFKINHSAPAIIKKKPPTNLIRHVMTHCLKVILSCTDCPFNGQDNVYCRTCSIPIREALRHLSEVQKVVVDGVVRYSLGASPSAFGIANPLTTGRWGRVVVPSRPTRPPLYKPAQCG